MKKIFVLSLVLLSLCGIGFAGQPFNTDDAVTVGKDNMQLELEYVVGITYGIPPLVDPTGVLDAKFDYGISDKLDIYIRVYHHMVYN